MNILYTTDGSEGALAGAHLLHCLPLGEKDHIRLLTVLQHEQEEEEGEPALTAACRALRGSAAGITRYIRRGNAAEEILEEILWEAEDAPTDLVVVGTHGRSAIARFLLGSVAERVARHAPCPVLLARPLRGGTLDRVLLGVDGSEHARLAAEWLRRRLPLPPGCSVRLQTVVTPEVVVRSEIVVSGDREAVQERAERERAEAKARLDEMAAAFQAAGIREVITDVRSDDAALDLLEVAESEKTDLLVVGARGLSGIERFLLGSVSDRVLRDAPCSVLVVRCPQPAV